jgi:hypothetical protein
MDMAALHQIPYNHDVAAILAEFHDNVSRILFNCHIEITLQQIEHDCEFDCAPYDYMRN